jgi:hypothetical protein
MNQSTNVPSDAERAEALAAIEAKRTEKIRAFQDYLARKLMRGTRANAEFAETVSENGLLWALDWSGRSTARTLAETEMWRQVEVAYASATSAEDRAGWISAAIGAVRMVRAEVERQLLSNQIRQSSSDEFANALSAARAEGYAWFYRDSGDALGDLTATDDK